MTLLKEIAGETAGMFVGNTGLALAIVALVAGAAAAVEWAHFPPLYGGGTLLLGSLAALVVSVLRGAAPRH